MFKKYKYKALFFIFLAIFSVSALSGSHWTSGYISNLSSTGVGLLIMLEGKALPDNCEGSPFGWMKIKSENKTMISVALTVWTKGDKQVTVYSSGLDSTGYCVITQFDPAN